MISTFSWLDYSEYDRQKMNELIARLGERETRDELGIGSVRDVFADLFFPGTSTIQTRVRYFFFVPWIYQDIEARAIPPRNIGQLVREQETRLIHALLKGGEKEGVIGNEAKDKLKRFPGSIYWQGLQRWDLRVVSWSQEQYHRWLARNIPLPPRTRKAEDESIIGLQRCWRNSIPHPPKDFLSRTGFDLEREEALYLRERILASAPKSLLAELVARSQVPPDVDFVWMMNTQNLSTSIQEQMEHAQNFSETMRGAAFLYNLMLAEKSNRQEEIQTYQQNLTNWADAISVRQDALAKWDRKRFWDIVYASNPRITHWTRTFVDNWLNWAIVPAAARRIAENIQARTLISERERQLKKALARLENPRALELWNGAAGTSQLDYRWRIARRHAVDIIEGARR